MSKPRRYTLDEISRISGITVRNIRYYMQKSLVDRHKGVGKGAYYTDQHLDQLKKTRQWKEAGLSLERIQEIVRGAVTGKQKPLPPPRPDSKQSSEVWHRFVISEGVELSICPDRSGLGRNQAHLLAAKLKDCWQDIQDD